MGADQSAQAAAREGLESKYKRLIEQNDELRKARQQELVNLERKYKAAQERIYEHMRLEAENFSNVSLQLAREMEELDHSIVKAQKKQSKLEKHRTLVEDREKHVAQLHSEYRANAAQLAHEYAVAAVEKIDANAVAFDSGAAAAAAAGARSPFKSASKKGRR